MRGTGEDKSFFIGEIGYTISNLCVSLVVIYSNFVSSSKDIIFFCNFIVEH